MSGIFIPNILLAIPRNPVTAVGLPIAFGFFSGTPASKVANSNWYYNLRSPPGLPPREVFPYVWALLYLSMGCASHIAVEALDNTLLEQNKKDLSLGLGLYFVQLGLNCIWSPIFFGAHQPGFALADSALLTGTACYMTKILHAPTNGKTTYFLLPYCLWLVYATYLNAGSWWLNRESNTTSK